MHTGLCWQFLITRLQCYQCVIARRHGVQSLLCLFNMNYDRAKR